MVLKRFRSFQRGTVSFCKSKGLEGVVWQASRMIVLSRYLIQQAQVVWRGKLQIYWQLVSLQPFDIQTPKVPFWKDRKLFKNTILTHKISRTFKIGFSLSKWLQLCQSEMAALLNKPYENDVTLRGQNIPLKCCQPLDFLYTSLKGLDLLMLQIWSL